MTELDHDLDPMSLRQAVALALAAIPVVVVSYAYHAAMRWLERGKAPHRR
jgi:hypothetical protein